MLGLHQGSVLSADVLVELLWGEDPPRTAAKALQTHISALRRALGDGFVLTQGTGWAIAESEVDASRYKSAARLARDAAATGDASQAVARFEEALALWRGIPELPDSRRGASEKTRWIEGHAALVEDRADALLATARAAEIIGELEAAVADAPLRERRWGQLMLALYRAGRQGDALGAYQRARTMLADELGIDPGSELRRLEAAIVAQDASLDVVVAQQHPSVMRAVTFLLTDIEGSTAAWEADAKAMAVALARHDELAEQVVTSRGGRLIKTRGEGDATFSVFERPSAAAAAAMELQDAITREHWKLREPIRIRIALHTGEVELRDGDYFGRAVNRAARLKSLAAGGQILCSGATAELVVDALPDDVVLADLGLRELRNLARPEHVFELRLETAAEDAQPPTPDVPPMDRPAIPPVLIGSGPFVGRGSELERLLSAWQTSLGGGACAALIAGEPGVGKTRLAGEWSRQAYDQGAVVLYGRCDEDLGAPYQPFAEALRSLVPCVGMRRLRGLRGVEALLPLVPGLVDEVPDLAAPTRADPDTERYALFDAVVALLELASAAAPVVLVLDDLHWAAKPTLLLLRHVLRFGDRARVQIVGTYRSTDLDRSHPLAAMLADLHRSDVSGTANRISLGGLDEDDVSAYVAEAGYDDEELGHALASVTGGNPFFLIEALRHVDESGGVWDPSTLPQGVREAVSRRLSRLPVETNKALAAAAVVGSRFALDLVERVVGDDLVDAFDEASKAGIVIEEPGGSYRFNHAIVRQSLLAELPSMRRMRLHQRIATTLEDRPGADDELLAELAHHYFECAWAGNAAKAVEYCRRAADQAMARLAYEGAAELYDHALHALDEIDDELPDRDDQNADLLVARCEALLAAGDVASAAGAVTQLQRATIDSARLSAWATCFDGQLSVLVHPERLDDVEAALGGAARKLAEIDDAAGEAKAHTVRATCLARLGRIGDCEVALDDALTAARRARDHRRVNAVLAGAPLAALWGPNPVPRAGGRCLDVVRLLRITTDSPAVEATSTRCQAVLEAFRGRDAAARRMIDSARRTVTELGLRHALLEVEQFAGIVELVLGDPAAAESHLRQACNGFRRMGLDADTAETAALLGRACLALNRDDDAGELCAESERLAGHALKASIAWRTLRAQLLSRSGDHGEARRVADAAVALAERTDGLVDHGDACLTLARVLGAAGDAAGARAAGEHAAELYERKGAAALADKARGMLDEPDIPSAPAPLEAPSVEPINACVQMGKKLVAAVHREAWDEVVQLFAPYVSIESHRKIVGFPRTTLPSGEWPDGMRRFLRSGMVRYHPEGVAVRGERLAVMRLKVGTADTSPGAPQDDMVQLVGLDEEGRIELEVSYDIEDVDAALAELDALHARLEEPSRAPLENAAIRVYRRLHTYLAACDWHAMAAMLADDSLMDDRRRVLGAGGRRGRDATMASWRSIAEIGAMDVTSVAIGTRGTRLTLCRTRGRTSDAFDDEAFQIVEIDADERMVALVTFDLEDFPAAIAELDARYLAGEAAAHARTWSVVAGSYAALNRREMAPTTPGFASIDHRQGTRFAPGDLIAYIRATWDLAQDGSTYVEAVHRLNDLGAVVTHVTHGSSQEGFDAEWREVFLITTEGDLLSRCELFDEDDLDAAIATFDELNRPAPRLENAASQAIERYSAHFAARDWDALAKLLADDISVDDRRPVVNAGTRHGRDAEIANLRATADAGFMYITSVIIAARGERLILTRTAGHDRGSEEFLSDALGILEINSHNQIAAIVIFDLDDFDAAIAELDARYLAGEAAAYAHTWSVVAAGYAGFNRRELLATTPDWVSIDHRRGAAFAPGDMTAYIQAAWDDSPDTKIYIGAVHRLSKIGAVVSHVAHGISQEGFDAEWRDVHVLAVEGETFSRSELFDEADLDAAIARFDELSQPARRLENSASRANERSHAYFAARDWDAIAEIIADDISTDDRRRVVNAGLLRGRDASIESFRWAADLGVTHAASDPIATRGERLVLARTRYSHSDNHPQPFDVDLLNIVEINADGRIGAVVIFDLEDFDAAIAELESRYIAGEAGAYAHTWSVITQGFATLNRCELPERTPDWVNIDHRRGTSIAPGEMPALLDAAWNVTSDLSNFIEAVHRLDNLGAVITHVANETSREGFHAEWRVTSLLALDGDLVSRCEVFDEVDVDAALARFEQLSRPARRLENAASQVYERFLAYFAARDWTAMPAMLADDSCSDDRRRGVNAGLHSGDAAIETLRAVADLGVTHATTDIVAIRGERLALTIARFSRGREEPEAFYADLLQLVEVDADQRITVVVAWDLDHFDAAFAELEARYLAGEAAPHARTWSAISGVFAALKRRELPSTTTEFVDIDHRKGAAFAAGELMQYLRAGWEVNQDVRPYVEVVHRLTNLGAVINHAAQLTSREGFEAEWRTIDIMTVDGDLINRCELFDETDLGAALAKFEQLSRPAPHLENTASQVDKRFQACFAARDWDVMAGMLSEGFSVEDRRRVVNAGNLQGRDAELTVHAYAAVGSENVTSKVIATREQRLVLSHYEFSGRDQETDAFRIEMLVVVEIDADERMAAVVVFDADDLDAAITELDVRYLAGEAAAYAQTWSLVVAAYAAFDRHELPAADWVTIDHRRATPFASSTMTESLRAMWDLTPDLKVHIEIVHQLTTFGAVVSHAGHATSREGFEAEWRAIDVLTIDGDRINRCEVFDEADLDAALAKFEQLSQPARRLGNAASQVYERWQTCLAARNWDAITEILAADVSTDDHRRVVNAGIRQGRDAVMAENYGLVEFIKTITSEIIAIRGERLLLSCDRTEGYAEFGADLLNVVEIDADERIKASVLFDGDDFEAAIAELDARYLAGEAAAHARTWSVMARTYAATNRQQLQLTPDCVSIDHRRARAFAPGELTAYMHATWDLAPNVRGYVEAVHRLNNVGSVFTHVVRGTSKEGFDAEWREVILATFEGDSINRGELFDEADLDAALARFEELHPQARRLHNAASQIYERLHACFADRDWDAMAETLGNNAFHDDRRQVVGAGLRAGPDAVIAEMAALAEIGVKRITFDPIATRGRDLMLSRSRASGRDERPDAFRTDVLNIVEIDAHKRFIALVTFDPDDFEAAIAELDARYLAGEASAQAQTWSAVAGFYAALNRHEILAAPDWVNVDHRRATTVASGDMAESIRATWEVAPNITRSVEAVHRLNNVGAVVTHTAAGTSREGFDAEWRLIALLTFTGDLISRCELFDEADLDAALARFEELQPRAPRLENLATRVYERIQACFAARNWNAIAEILAEDVSTDDRRRVVGGGIRDGRDAVIVEISALAELGVKNFTAEVIATRGSHLALSRVCSWGRDQRPEEFATEVLDIIEIDADERIAARVAFDVEDFEAAIKELDARYIAGEASAHPNTWSLIARAFAAINRHEFPELTPDWANIDHRRGAAFATGDMTNYIRDLWDDAPDINVYVEAVHCLTHRGAVISQAAHGTSQHGFEAEWRENAIFTFDGDLLNRCELFDEADLDAALARFDELRPQLPRVENAAGRIAERYFACFSARDWPAMAELLAVNIVVDDRRRIVNAGTRRGRDTHIADNRAAVEVGAETVSSSVIATRGERLALSRIRSVNRGLLPGEVGAEMLGIVEIDDDERAAAAFVFDADDMDAALKELDARYLAGEAAANARTWSVITAGYASLNRREIPSTPPNFKNIDHRRGASFAPGDLIEYLHAGWDLDQDVHPYVEAVHRLSDLGAVVTHAAYGTSREGFDAEWREVSLFTSDGDMVDRCELFDEADLDAALARFDELHSHTRRLENAASQVEQRFLTYFAARDWATYAEILSDDVCMDDRRQVVNAGIRRGRDAEIASMRSIADVGVTRFTSNVIAIRGERLSLGSYSVFDGWGGSTVLSVSEINAENQIVARVAFDPEDFDAAFAELDARYLAGEAAAHAHTWSLVMQAQAAWNRHKFFPNTEDWVNIDHRRGRAYEQGGLKPFLRASWSLIPDAKLHTETVHRLTIAGVVSTVVATGTSAQGFDAEWREICLVTFDGDLLSRCELFDEADLDAALARFDELQPQAPRLENAASQVEQRFLTYFAARDWDAYAEILSDDVCIEDRRHVVNAGVRHGREAEIANVRALAAIGVRSATSTVIAVRGGRLFLGRLLVWGGWSDSEASETLCVLEINAENQIVARVLFDADDVDAAFTELDARYLAGKAASHAHIWTAITKVQAVYNRHEVPATTADCVNIDHRSGIAFAPGDVTAYIGATYDVAPNVKGHLEAVHRLGSRGVVVTEVVAGTSQEGFAFEWREVALFAFEGDLVSRFELFDETDLDAALTRFDELQPQAPRLENRASRMSDRYLEKQVARDWGAMAEMLADDFQADDRRPVVGGGVHGRDSEIANARASADVGVVDITPTVIATRGEHLALSRYRYSICDQGLETSVVEILVVGEINAEGRAVAAVAFDLDDIAAAVAELDARYLAGEAAAHPESWSAITQACAALSRHEMPRTASNFVDIDHRQFAAISPGDLLAYVRAGLEDMVDNVLYVEAVHRLTALGAVVTHTAKGTSREGFDAEWQMIDVFTVDGDLLSRFEIFDESDLDAAIARFDELQPQTPRLENAASQVYERFQAHFATSDWDAIADMLTADLYSDDRRPFVGGGIRTGQDALIEDLRAVADVEVTHATSDAIATRGGRLVLARARYSRGPGEPDPFHVDFLQLVEIDTDNRITAFVAFDTNDIDAAIAELDARYLAGEAAAYAPTWSAMTQVQAAWNRHELPPVTKDLVTTDHRRGRAFTPGDVIPFLRATYDVAPSLKGHIEAVHRLSNRGAVVTEVMIGTSQEGFDAEWREIGLFAFDGDLVCRFELFDEADLDHALAHFDELQTQAPRLENAASRAHARLTASVAAHDWNALSEILADDIAIDDRRRVVNSGVVHGRDAAIADMGGVIEVGLSNISSTVIATRGDRLDLCRTCVSGQDRPDAFQVEFFSVVEIDADDQIVARFLFDPEDFDAAFAELDARYLAGEAAAYSDVWTFITNAYATLNRHELPPKTSDWATVDHRAHTTFAGDGLTAYLRAGWDLTPDIKMYIEAVPRLSEAGAVIIHSANGSSREGFDAEWRMILLLTIGGGLVKHGELFDEQDLDAAIARFDELQPEAPRLENAASQVGERFLTRFAARDWEGMAELLDDDYSSDDRRRVVGAGVRHGRDAQITDLRAIANLWITNLKMTVIATRGERLVLTRTTFSGRDQGSEAFLSDVLDVAEINTDERYLANVSFELDDLDAAFEELDARYLAGETAAHSHTWSVVTRFNAAFNRHEIPATDWVTIDHRRLITADARDQSALIREVWKMTPDLSIHIEAVHRLSSVGAVVTRELRGTSREGFEAEWRMIQLLTVEGDRVNRSELFDESDLDVALARFEEIRQFG